MKKLLVIIGMITCMATLAACGQEEGTAGPFSAEQALSEGQNIIEMMNALVSYDAIEQYADDPAVYNGCQDWKSAQKDIGEYQGADSATSSYTDDGAVITVNVLGSSHNAEVEIALDDTYTRIVGITTNVQYSMGEILFKALMNTLIGMGTVFVVLILISLIISCFTLISRFEKKQKKEEPAPAAAPVVQQIAAKEELSDDTELVAVIAAAIAAYEGAASTDGFVVRSIRKSNKSKWQNA